MSNDAALLLDAQAEAFPDLCAWVAERRASDCPAQVFNAMCAAGLSPASAVAALAAAVPGLHPRDLATLLRPCPNPRFPGAPFRLAGRELQLVREHRQPHLAVVENLLSTAECDAIIDEARPRLTPSTVVDLQGRMVVADGVRSSSSAPLRVHESALAQLVVQRAAALLDWPATHFEHVFVTRYGVGEQYRPHRDYFKAGSPGLRLGGQRVATLLAYLNTPQQGGCTFFEELSIEVPAVRGHALFFSYPSASASSRTLHAGRPVHQGEKWIAALFLRQGPYTPDPWPGPPA